jgi:hypothetical protein
MCLAVWLRGTEDLGEQPVIDDGQSCRRARGPGRVITLTLNIVPAKGLILLNG